jgi:hypothetical protein
MMRKDTTRTTISFSEVEKQKLMDEIQSLSNEAIAVRPNLQALLSIISSGPVAQQPGIGE